MLNYLGEWNQETNEVNNPRFHHFLSKGTEHAVYLDGNDILKIYFGRIASSEEGLKNIADTIIKNRNSVSEQIPISLEGYVTSFGILYPVFKQEKLKTPENEAVYNSLIEDLRNRLTNNGWKFIEDYDLFYNKELDVSLEDVSLENVGIKNGKLYIIDGFVHKVKKASP